MGERARPARAELEEEWWRPRRRTGRALRQEQGQERVQWQRQRCEPLLATPRLLRMVRPGWAD